MGYVSRRHALPPLLPLFGYVGTRRDGARLLARASRATRVRVACAVGLAARDRASIAVLVAIGELATQRVPRRDEERAARAAAEWLRDHRPPGLLATTRSRLGYYAGMPYVALLRVERCVARVSTSTSTK